MGEVERLAHLLSDALKEIDRLNALPVADTGRERDKVPRLPLLERVQRAEKERDALQEIVCRIGDAIHGTQYVGSHGLKDILEAWERIGRDFQEEVVAAETAKRTTAGDSLASSRPPEEEKA